MSPITDFAKILELKRYSKSTIGSYVNSLKLLKLTVKKPFKAIDDKEMFEFVYFLVNKKGISASYQRQIVGGLKLFYKEIYNRAIPFEYLKVVQRERKLPVVLSNSEVKRILDSTHNLKHKAILAMIYGSGLRIGELLELKKTDIDSDRMLVYIRAAKGKKDRYTLLSNKALAILRQYYKEYRPKTYLFEGQKGGKYSAESSRSFFRKSMNKAKINKYATLHTLRHSFATHLLEEGIGIAYIQKLLGHNTITTTLIYTHIAQDATNKIKSPLDI